MEKGIIIRIVAGFFLSNQATRQDKKLLTRDIETFNSVSSNVFTVNIFIRLTVRIFQSSG